MRASPLPLCFAVFTAAYASEVAAQAPAPEGLRAETAAAARMLIDAGLVPGMGVAVVAGDRVVHADGFGAAELGSGRPVTGDTPFYIASTTKSFTALAASIAAERGELDLDAPMTRYLPDAQLHDRVERDAITVRHLITLTHGLEGDGPIVMRTAYTGEFTRDELLRLLRHHAPSGERGTFAYDNLGYNLLGLILERIYDEPWQDIVDRMVLEPAGMRGTSARLSTLDRERIALPHAIGVDGWTSVALLKDDANMHAAGAHFASARDLARYVAAHISGGLVEGERVLPEAPTRETQRLHATQNRNFGPYHRHAWGYGWDIGTYGADTLVHRFGSFSGYRSHVSFMPQRGYGVVVLVNGDGPASFASDLLATHIYDVLLGKGADSVSFRARVDSLANRTARYRTDLAAHLAERAERQQPLRHPLEHFAGTYENELFGTIVWRIVADGIEARAGIAHSRAEVYDASDDALRVELFGSGQVARFDFPEAGGPATGFTFAEQHFRRVPERP